MAEWRFFEVGSTPECATSGWYAERDSAPHIDQPNHRPRLELACEHIRRASETHDLNTLVDLGAGDGGLLSILPPNINGWGYDLQPSNVAMSGARDVDVIYADVLHDAIVWGEMAVATEMIEHLIDPYAFVRTVASRARVLIASSPKDETPDDHYEHHLWAWDMPGYRQMIESCGMVVTHHDPCGPFQVLTAVTQL